MGEFLEYIKQVNEQINKGRKKKFNKLKELPNDSISEISDLSNEGILSTSLNKLSIQERKRLTSFVFDLRKVQASTLHNPIHNCRSKPGTNYIENSKQVVEMQLLGF